MRYQSGVS